MTRWITLAVAGASLASATASADVQTDAKPKLELRTVISRTASPSIEAGALAGSTIFLNRCQGGGCTMTPGPDDASVDRSQLVSAPTTLAEYTGFTGTEWADTLKCVQEVYSPFNVHVVDARPPTTVNYTEIIVAGNPADLGMPNGVGGVASVDPFCNPIPKGVSYAFTSAINIFAAEAGGSRVHGLCWIIAQETAHTFGLEHEYVFTDQTSACNDPMTYRADCGGQKFYRNKFAQCGEDMPRSCRCGNGLQNSHSALLNIFGDGASIVPPPTAAITLPAANGQLGASVIASIGSKRGIERAEVYLNGYKWRELKGAAFGAQGQANPTSYQFTLPSEIPNSVYDVVVKGYDDLGIVGTSPTIVATKGSGCQSADTCLKGQKCENQRCFWDPPSGAIGDECTYNQFCTSGICQGTADQTICTQECIPGTEDSCPQDLDMTCVQTTPGKGVCFFKADEGGCCSTGRESSAWIPGGIGALLFGFLVFRPRRKRS